jgi:nitrous oxidase accessory protein NosD
MEITAMNATRTLLAALTFNGLAAAAQAQDITVMSQGENFSVQYSPEYPGNIVGGGEIVSIVGGREGYVVYDSANHVASHGIPSFTGGSEGDVIYTPAGTTTIIAAR